MPRYRHLFIDLDHTLWDFETNLRETLNELYYKYDLQKTFESTNSFYNIYTENHKILWQSYRQGRLNKEKLKIQRFLQLFSTTDTEAKQLANLLSQDYDRLFPGKGSLMPHCTEILQYLTPKYKLYVISNGIKKEQLLKIESANIKHYFERVFTSEEIGVSKPKQPFFEYAIKSVNARKKESLIIGDNLQSDIKGAKNFNLDHIFFNPHNMPHNEPVMHEIASLQQLKDIL